MNNEQFIDMKIVRNNPHKRWNKLYLSMNEQLTVKDVETLILPTSYGNWSWTFMSQYIDIQEIRNNPNQPWSKSSMSCNKQLTMKDINTLILPNSIGEWNWSDITRHIDIQEVINNPDRPWSKYRLVYNEGSTPKILEFHRAGLLKHLQKNIPKFQYHADIVINCDY